MHGVTKADIYDVPEEKKKERAKKTQMYKALATEVLRRRAEKVCRIPHHHRSRPG